MIQNQSSPEKRPEYATDLATRKLSRRHLLAGAAAIVSATTLAACEDPEIVEIEVEPIFTVEVEKTVTVEVTPEPIENVMWAWPFHEVEFQFSGLNPDGANAVRAEIIKFRSLTNIEVKPSFYDWERSYLNIVAGIQSQAFPDVWYAREDWTPSFAAGGWLLAIDEYVDAWEEWNDFYPAAIDGATWDGHVHGVPFSANYRGSPVIRASHFEEAGLAPDPPRTWEELNEVSRRLTIRDGSNYIRAGVNLQHHAHVYEDWLVQAGGKIFSDDLSSPRNDSPEGIAALSQHVRPGSDDHSMPKEGVDSGIPRVHAFCAGRVSVQQLWPGNVGNCEINAPDVFADIVVGEPLRGPADQAMQIHVNHYMVSRQTGWPDASFEAMKYFASPGPNYDINVVSDRTMPCRGAMEAHPIYQSGPYNAFMQNAKFGKNRQIAPMHAEIQPAMSRWVVKAALAELTVEDALAGMDREVSEILRRQ